MRSVSVGDYVLPNRPLLTIVDLEQLLADVYVPESYLSQISVGQTARLRSDAAPQADIVAEIARIAPVVDPRTGQMRVPTMAEYCRRNPAACRDVSLDDECKWYDLRCNLKENWWKVLLGGAAVVMLYNASAGVGRRIGRGK